jgi:hypothetical protein
LNDLNDLIGSDELKEEIELNKKILEKKKNKL